MNTKTTNTIGASNNLYSLVLLLLEVRISAVTRITVTVILTVITTVLVTEKVILPDETSHQASHGFVQPASKGAHLLGEFV